jgi:hypothetical protein
MIAEFESIRNEIRHCRIIDKDYLKAISKCKAYLKVLNSFKDKNVKTDKWFCYHDMALSNKKSENINEAIKSELLAVNNTEGTSDFRYYSSLWMIAECNTLQNNNIEALNLYNQCSKFYKYIKDENLRCAVIFNKAKIYKSVKAMLKIIKIYEEKNFKQVIKTYGDFKCDDILTEMYTDLTNFYIEVDKQAEAFRLLYILKDKSLRKELGEKLLIA